MTIQDSIQSFRDAAIEKGEGSEDPSRDHDLHQAMSDAFHQLYAQGQRGREAFLALLSDESPLVRSWVAAQLLSEGCENAKSVLEELEKQEGMLGFDAEMTLQEYRKGRLGSPFPK